MKIVNKQRSLLCGAILLGLNLTGCAAPALQLYTLAGNSGPSPFTGSAQITASTPVIKVERVVLPDYLDTLDIVTRDGLKLNRSQTGRWASRLSLGATDLITSKLAERYATSIITDQAPALPPSARLQINISRLDIETNQSAILDATWALIPRDEHTPISRARVHLQITGQTNTDAATTALVRMLIVKLSQEIQLPPPV